MSSVVTDIQPFAQVGFAPTQLRETEVTSLQCLVISASDERRAMFEEAASSGGFDPVLCRSGEEALTVSGRFRFPLVIVDLQEAGDQSAGYRELVEHIAAHEDALLMLCGEEENPLEEIWARQHGAWLYLPGVDTSCDVTTLCCEAKDLADKLFADLAA